ncbi:hypothetical protein S245_066016 [Arachis hypogaea]
MAESSCDISSDLLLLHAAAFPSAMATEEDHHATPCFLCSPLLVQHAATSPFTMAVPRHVFVFATSSSIRRCIPFASPLLWQHLAAVSPSAMAEKNKKKRSLCHGSTSPLRPLPLWQTLLKLSAIIGALFQ